MNVVERARFLVRAASLVAAVVALASACGPVPVTGDDPLDGALPDAGGAGLDARPPGGDAARDGAPAVETSGGAGLPCEVDRVLAARCRSCHAATPLFGAPMPLITLRDLQAPAPSDPSRTVWQRVAVRIHDPRSPMPPAPNPPLAAADLAALDGWIAGGAPAAPAGTRCDVPDGGRPPPDVAPPPDGSTGLPCTPTHRFLAHAAGSPTQPFAVPRDAGNLYECFTFRSPFNRTTQATAWAPVIGDARVLHHWILYKTRTPQTDGGVSRCRLPADATFLMGWAPGGRPSVLPPNVGLELRSEENEWLILQAHYWNTTGIADAVDGSGVAICTTETPRAQTAGVLTLGTVAISIPPRTTGYTASGNCTQRLSVPLYALASGPHMHTRGRSIRTDILRGGAASRMENLVRVDRWEFDNQTSYGHDPVVPLMPGDVLRTTCVYDNTGTSTVRFGERTEDEMCFNFALVYPITAIPAGVPRVCLF